MGDQGAQAYLELVDWRRRVGDLYRVADRGGLDEFRAARDVLFGTHPQSPLPDEDRAAFPGLDYFRRDPELRLETHLEPAETEDEVAIDTGGPDGVIRYRRVGRLPVTIAGQEAGLTVFSIVGYGGGLFLPFRDQTSGQETYGGGRYLFDTIKNTDAGCLTLSPGSLAVVIDFNYAYNPSCAYNHRWACPLAPQENWLAVAVRGGEKAYLGALNPA